MGKLGMYHINSTIGHATVHNVLSQHYSHGAVLVSMIYDLEGLKGQTYRDIAAHFNRDTKMGTVVTMATFRIYGTSAMVAGLYVEKHVKPFAV